MAAASPLALDHKMKKILLAYLILLLPVCSWAEPAPKWMKEFNKTCPATKLCPKLERQYQECKIQLQGRACIDFVNTMEQLAPIYDCQRSFDSTPTENYIVPAIWLCGEERRENGIPVVDDYLELLSKLNIPEARRYFGSKLFRSTLDGYYAELYREASEKVEAELSGKDRRKNNKSKPSNKTIEPTH